MELQISLQMIKIRSKYQSGAVLNYYSNNIKRVAGAVQRLLYTEAVDEEDEKKQKAERDAECKMFADSAAVATIQLRHPSVGLSVRQAVLVASDVQNADTLEATEAVFRRHRSPILWTPSSDSRWFPVAANGCKPSKAVPETVLSSSP